MREDTTVTIIAGVYSCFIPETATAFISFWESKIAMVPAEFIDTARIEIKPNEYDEADLDVTVTYVRPENDEEVAAREMSDEARKERMRAEKFRKYNELKQELCL